MILAQSPRRQRVAKFVNWGHWFALANIVIAIIIASIFVFSSPLPGTTVGTLYLFSNWFGHIGFLTFFGFVIFVLPLCYLVNNANLIKGTASVIAAVGLAFLAFDALMFNRTGVHVSFQSTDFLKTQAQHSTETFSWQACLYLLMLFLVWLGFQLMLANALWKRMDKFARFKVGAPVSGFFVVCFVSSHLVHVWADANLYQPIIKQDSMFPLSYPATAKTTMSRYGLLDLNAYQERKTLQFNSTFHNIRYPVQPIYCSIDSTKNVALIVQTDKEDIGGIDDSGLNVFNQYYSSATSFEGLVYSTLFGVPEIYQDQLRRSRPVMLALPMGLGMPVSMQIDEQYQSLVPQAHTNTAFGLTNGLNVLFADSTQIQALLNRPIATEQTLIIATGFGNTDMPGKLYTNLTINASIASTEDLVPTVLDVLGCNADTSDYSTGQSLINPTRDWLVSTSGERVVVWHNNTRTEVLSNGSYTIIDTDTQNRSSEPLDIDLLGQAIKHLSRFSYQH